VDDAPEICATARSGLMCLTGRPAIRTGCSHSLRGCGDYVAVAAGAAKGAIIAFSGALPCERWSLGNQSDSWIGPRG